MATGGLSLAGLGLVAGGAVLAWSGVNDPDGGPIGVVRDILSGRTPRPGVQKVTAVGSAVGGLLGGAVANVTGGNVGSVAAGAVAGLVGSRAVAVAETYLGVPYRFGGADRSGIDCSGLVLVAYRDGLGIKLPHLATAQAARGHLVPRAQVAPGDLVAWGVPGNYPHIALATGPDQVIVAPTWGQRVQHQKLWEAKVTGFGYPDIYRIT